jgi:sugar-phosphatase
VIGPFRAILSDLDGVLVDSGDSIVRTWRRWAAGQGVPQARPDGLMHGRPSPDVVGLVASHVGPEAEAAAIDRMENERRAAAELAHADALAASVAEALARYSPSSLRYSAR